MYKLPFDKMIVSVLHHNTKLDCDSASILKQQPTFRHAPPIISKPSQSVFDLTPLCCGLRGEETYSSFIVFGLTRPRIDQSHARRTH